MKQYRKLPPKKAETTPWDTLCVYLIGKYQFTPKEGGKQFSIQPKGDEKKYKMTTKLGRSVYFQAVTMIDLTTGWKEIRNVSSARTHLEANQVELTWLSCYPLPSKIIVDSGNEPLAEFREMIINDYGITVKPITSRNLQPNATLERVHQTIGNVLYTFKVQNMVQDDKNRWDGILASAMFALRATVHTTTQYTPVQLIFIRVSIINRRHNID